VFPGALGSTMPHHLCRCLIILIALAAGVLTACDSKPQSNTDPSSHSLTDARKTFVTKLTRQSRANSPLEAPPPKLFRSVKFTAPVGELDAYISVPPTQGQKYPAIIWIVGGLDNSIGSTAWTDSPAENDQSASAFRKAGIITMFPSLRGGNTNPGVKECFMGEVDDVLAAADFLARQPEVDPHRIYLGGHSTGGTLAILVAESSDRFSAVFAFGPVDDVSVYGEDDLPFNIHDAREVQLRSPIHWLRWIHTPTFVFEGAAGGNIASLKAMEKASTNDAIGFYPIKSGNHFSILAPATRFIAEKILRDTQGKSNITFTAAETDGLMQR
jgi:acetyl esterase/lipase